MPQTSPRAAEVRPITAQGTRSAFHHDVQTAAAPEVVWRLWTDVSTWPSWDTELEWARLEGVFGEGAKGVLKGKGNPRSRFTVEAVEPHHRYRLTTALPMGGRLVIERTLAPLSRGTRFRHQVRFEGPGGAVLALVLGGRYRAALPRAMERIKVLAEAGEVGP